MAKKTLSPEQKMMKAIYGKPIEDMNDEEKKAAYEKAKRLQDRFQFPNKSISFDIPCDEKTMDFFNRMQEEHVEREKAIKARIKQLFDEFIGFKGDDAAVKDAYNQVLQVFCVGYQLGWNDRKAVEEESNV